MPPAYSPHELFFFDFPLVDATAISNSAMRLLYYGSTHGAFGLNPLEQRPMAVNLEDFDAFKITLEHLSNEPLSEEYEYNLVYLTKDLASDLWNGSKRSLNPELKKLTRRVLLGGKPSLNAKRYKAPIWVKFQRPIYLALFDGHGAQDHYIPPAYGQQFINKFTGFLMRTKKDYPLVRTLFETSNLNLSGRREVQDRLDGTLQVLSYQLNRQIKS